MAPLALIARSGPLLAMLALWLQVLGGGVLPALRAGSLIVAPLCHSPGGRVAPVLPAHLDDCDSCVLCTAPAAGQAARAVMVPPPRLEARAEAVATYPSFVSPRRYGAHRPRGPPVAVS